MPYAVCLSVRVPDPLSCVLYPVSCISAAPMVLRCTPKPSHIAITPVAREGKGHAVNVAREGKGHAVNVATYIVLS